MKKYLIIATAVLVFFWLSIGIVYINEKPAGLPTGLPIKTLGTFSDPFISIQLAASPSNGNCLTTDGTDNAWGSCGTGGSSAYDAWTHPIAGTSATTSSMIFNSASSTFNDRLNVGYIMASSTTATSTFAGGISSLGFSSFTGLSASASSTFAGVLNVSGNGIFNAKVGIGTVSPSELLHIRNAGNTFMKITNGANDFFLGVNQTDYLGVGAFAGDVTMYSDNGIWINGGGNINLTSGSPSSAIKFFSYASSTFANTAGVSVVKSLGIGSTGTTTILGDLSTSTFSGGIKVGTSGGISTASGLTITGGSILNTSTATSTFAGGISSAGLASSVGLTVNGTGFVVNQGVPANSFNVNANGSVGIGTVAPQTILNHTTVNLVTHIKSETANSRIIIEGTAAWVDMIDNDATADKKWFVFGSSAGLWQLYSLTDAASIVSNNIITASTAGLVGIGTGAPLSKLGVLGNASIGATYGAIAAPTSGLIVEGNVGIGETAPGSKLSVSGGGTFGASYDTTAAPTNGLLVQGNVGIGTTSPTEQLSVANRFYIGGTGTSTIENNLYVMGTLRATVSYVGDLIFSNLFRFIEDVKDGLERLVLKNRQGQDIMIIDEKGTMTVKKICLEEICIDKKQLEKLLKLGGDE